MRSGRTGAITSSAIWTIGFSTVRGGRLPPEGNAPGLANRGLDSPGRKTGDAVFAAGRRGNSLSHAPAWPLIRAAHLSKIRIVPEAVTGYSTCGVCKKLRERSGVCDWAGREDYAHRWALAAEAIDVRAAMNKEWPVSSFCACGEHPDRIPKEW